MSEPDPKLNPERLDYSKDPPGAPLVGAEFGLYVLVHEMWSVYKRWNNPPGMWVGFARAHASVDQDQHSLDQAYTRFGLRGRLELSVSRTVTYVAWRHEARKDAWEYYDTRIAVAGKLEAAGVRNPWPRALRILDLGPYEAWLTRHRANARSAGPCPELPSW